MAKNRTRTGFPSAPDRAPAALQPSLGAGQDVRRPLWTILASTQLLLRSRGLSPRDARLVDRIHAAARRLGRQAPDLFDPALVDAGGLAPLQPRATHVRALAGEALVEARVENPDRWIVEAGTGDGSVAWDHERILHLLSNLLAHALEHGVDHAPVSLAWRSDDEGDEIVLEIEYAPAPGSDPRWTPGLSVAREIARSHRGELTVLDGVSGRRFQTVLPRSVRERGAQRRGPAHEAAEADDLA